MSPMALGIIAFAGVIAAVTGVFSVLLGAGVFHLTSATKFLATLAGKATLCALGAFLLAVSINYASIFFRRRAQLSHFSQDGQWGRIELSPYALRELVSGIMREEIGIDRFKAQLGHLNNGLSIRITTTLSPKDRVTDVGKLIQDTLSSRVAEHTGVEVSEVSVLVNSIQSLVQEPDSKEEEENEHSFIA